jgi:hypothetical protein
MSTCVVGLDDPHLELPVQHLAGIAPAHAVDQLVVEVRIACQLASERRLLLLIASNGFEKILAALARVPGIRAVVMLPRSDPLRVHGKDVFALKRRHCASRERKLRHRHHGSGAPRALER